MLSWGVGVSFVTPRVWLAFGGRICLFCVDAVCVTEASALLAGALTIFCTVYDRGGCALARVQFILCAVPLVACTLYFVVSYVSVQGAHLACVVTQCVTAAGTLRAGEFKFTCVKYWVHPKGVFEHLLRSIWVWRVFSIRCRHATVAGLRLVAVHSEFAAWFVSLAGVQLADRLFVCCVVAGCGRLVGPGADGLFVRLVNVIGVQLAGAIILCCVVCDFGRRSVCACVSDLLCGKWLLVDRYVHHLLCGA